MIEGLEHLHRISIGLKSFSKTVKRESFSAAVDEMIALRNEMVQRTPIDTGLARSSWSQVQMDGNDLSFQLNVPYGFVLDVGSTHGDRPWPSPGPKTVLYRGRIFSSQVADGEGGIVKDILTEERKGLIANSVLNALGEILSNALG